MPQEDDASDDHGRGHDAPDAYLSRLIMPPPSLATYVGTLDTKTASSPTAYLHGFAAKNLYGSQGRRIRSARAFLDPSHPTALVPALPSIEAPTLACGCLLVSRLTNPDFLRLGVITVLGLTLCLFLVMLLQDGN